MTLTVPDFNDACVLVAGDVMLDRYWFGPTGRISPEAPVPVVNVNAVEERPGGAANVAANLASLGVRTRLLGVTGDDEAAGRLQSLTEAQGIDTRLQRDPGFNTVTKLRVLSRNQQLIRLDFDPHPASHRPTIAGKAFGELLDGVDAVVLSDYGKGGLAEVAALIQQCRDARVPVLVDPKGGDFQRYRGASVITPNLAEFTAVAGTRPRRRRLRPSWRSAAGGAGPGSSAGHAQRPRHDVVQPGRRGGESAGRGARGIRRDRRRRYGDRGGRGVCRRRSGHGSGRGAGQSRRRAGRAQAGCGQCDGVRACVWPSTSAARVDAASSTRRR